MSEHKLSYGIGDKVQLISLPPNPLNYTSGVKGGKIQVGRIYTVADIISIEDTSPPLIKIFVKEHAITFYSTRYVKFTDEVDPNKLNQMIDI